MKSSRSSEDQIIGILKQHQAGLGAAEPRRSHGISDASVCERCSKSGGMEVSAARQRFGYRRLPLLP